MSQTARTTPRVAPAEEHLIYVFEVGVTDEDGAGRAGTPIRQGIERGKDIADILAAHREFGGDAYYRKSHGGKDYIIFKGRAGKRPTITGTRHLEGNAKLVQVGIGRRGIAAAAKGNAVLSIVLCTGQNVVQHLVDDTHTMGMLIGHTLADAVKAVLSAGAGLGAYALAGAVLASGTLVVAVGAIIAVIAVTIGTGLLLDTLDDRHGVSTRLAEAIDTAIAETKQGVMDRLVAGYAQFESGFIRWVTRGTMSLNSR